MLWGGNGTFNNIFFQLTDQVTTSLDLQRKAEWLSPNEIYEKYGDETDAIIADGTIRVRTIRGTSK